MGIIQDIKEGNKQTKWMAATIILLLVLIIMRWSYISRTAGEAFKERINYHIEKIDTTINETRSP